MSKVSIIVKNITTLFSANVVTGILAFFINILIARHLGDVNFGKYTFALAFVSLFTVLSHLGIHIIVVRDVAREKSSASEYLGNALLLVLILSTVTYILIIILINILNYPYDTKLIVYIIGIAVISESIALIFKAIFRAFEKMEYEAFVLLLGRIIFFCSVLLVFHFGYSLIVLVLSYLASNFISLFLCILIASRKFIMPKFKINLNFMKYLLTTAVPFALAGVLNMIYIRTDTIMLSIMKGDAVVGWYNAAYTLVLSLSLLNNALVMALLPPTSKAFVTSIERLNIIYEKSFRYTIMFLSPIAVGTTLLADKIIIFVYPEEFINSAIALRILIWSGVASFLNGLYYMILGAINKQKITSVIMGCGAIVNVFLNLLLIPNWSYIGAGLATVVTQGVCLILGYYFTSKYLYKLQIYKNLKPTMASLIMGISIVYLNNIGLQLLIVIFIATVIYFCVLVLIRGFDKDDWRLVKQLIYLE